MANAAMIETFEQATRVPVDYTYAAFALIAVGLMALLFLLTVKSAWERHQKDELTLGDVFMIITRSVMLFMFFLLVLTV